MILKTCVIHLLNMMDNLNIEKAKGLIVAAFAFE